MDSHTKASLIADKLRNIRLDAIVTAEDVLDKCESVNELNFYYTMLCSEV
ncbi:MAG: hypothetical protein K5979_09220 [Ruminococcus sp.]|nr:hypothetical protein [Ruminococcus sp.]